LPGYGFAVNPPGDEARARIQRLLVTGDNRLKQGVAPEKARESYEQALEAAREAGLEDAVRPLVELRLADLERLARESPRSSRPDA
jgi:predicted negative regulator of RcsB-dependent stress response